MISHIVSDGRLLGLKSLSDVAYILLFIDFMAFSVLVTFWHPAGRVRLWPARVRDRTSDTDGNNGEDRRRP